VARRRFLQSDATSQKEGEQAAERMFVVLTERARIGAPGFERLGKALIIVR
jgi:hypothetical protein